MQFTKSNLYWDGSAFKFEANQYDYPTSWSISHVDHFYWTKTAAASYAASYSDGTNSSSDVPFFAESQGGLTVEDTEGLYALSSAEWTYLLNTRTVNGGTGEGYSWKRGVAVAGKTSCLIIAPDGYTGTIASSYDADAWTAAEAAGLVCLPAAGYRNGSELGDGDKGYYWSATPNASDEEDAYDLYFSSDTVEPAFDDFRESGYSLRLVK